MEQVITEGSMERPIDIEYFKEAQTFLSLKDVGLGHPNTKELSYQERQPPSGHRVGGATGSVPIFWSCRRQGL